MEWLILIFFVALFLLSVVGSAVKIVNEWERGVILRLGRLVDAKLSRPKGATATQRLVRRRTGSLIPYEGKYRPDLSELN